MSNKSCTQKPRSLPSPPLSRSLCHYKPGSTDQLEHSSGTKRRRSVSEHAGDSSPEPSRKRNKAGAVQEPLQDSIYPTQGGERENPIRCWARTGRWPHDFGAMSSPTSDASNKRRRSSTPSYSSRERDGSVPPAHSAAYEEELQRYGIMFDDVATKDLVVAESKKICQDLLSADNFAPAYNSCSEETYIRVFQRATKYNEERVRRDLTPHIVPSAELLHVIDRDATLENIREEMSVDWSKCSLLGGTRPRPDYAFGLSSATFTEYERAKLDNYTNVDNPTKFTESLYFPFLLCEVKCGKKNINDADRQNVHSASIAVKAILQLFRSCGMDVTQTLSGQILVFSISHDNERVKIYGHFPLIRDGQTTFHRYYIHDYSLDGHYGRNRNTGSNFTRAIYRDFYPLHLQRIREAIARLPDPPPTMTLGLNNDEGGTPASEHSSQESGASQLRRAKSQGSQMELTLMKQTLATVEKMHAEQIKQQQKQMEQQREESRKQLEQQKEESQKQIALLERLLERQSK